MTHMVKIVLDSPEFIKAVQGQGQRETDEVVLRQMTADQRKRPNSGTPHGHGSIKAWSVPDFIDTGLGCQIG